MALADYKLCDVCGKKAFYDANLSYEDRTEAPNNLPYREAGELQFTASGEDFNREHGMTLGYLGDWAVICRGCSSSYKTAIVRISPHE